MPVGHLWYVRRGEQQRGPYPTAVMERNIGLGRILATDLLSADGEHWLAATDFPDFELHQRSLETGLARQMEERQHERRTSAEVDSATMELRKGADRRRPEDPIEVQSREKSYRVWRGLASTRIAPARMFGGIGIAVFLLMLVSWQVRRAETPHKLQCDLPAAGGVAWDFCDKQGARLSGAQLARASLKNSNLIGADLQGADLSGADLAYANLSTAKLLNADLRGANLTGAVLRGADLSGAELGGANLTFADLSDAKLAATSMQKAVLAQALWSNGVVCAASSVGVCVMRGAQASQK